MYLKDEMFSGGPKPERNSKCECGEGEVVATLLNTRTGEKKFYCGICIGAVAGSPRPPHIDWVDVDE